MSAPSDGPATIDGLFAGPADELAKGRGREMAAAMERLLSGVWRTVDGR